MPTGFWVARVLDGGEGVDIDDPRILEAYAEIGHTTESTGQPLAHNDIWIGATAHATWLVHPTTDRDFAQLYPTWINRNRVDPTIAKP